jgi:hypothetical protein
MKEYPETKVGVSPGVPEVVVEGGVLVGEVVLLKTLERLTLQTINTQPSRS